MTEEREGQPEASRSGQKHGRSVGRYVLWAVFGAVVVFGVALMALPDTIEVDLGIATRGPLEITVQEDGRTRVKDRYVVAAPVDGNLLRIDLEPGDAVEVGEPLAVVAPRTSPLLDPKARASAEARVAAAEAALEQARAAVSRAEAALALADQETEAQRARLEATSGTRYALERARLEQRAREEELRSARLGVQVAEYELESTRAALRTVTNESADGEAIRARAPIAGQVLRVLHESAGPVAAGTPLVEIGDPGSLEVVVDVLTTDAVRIQPGCRAYLQRWGGERTLAGHVHRVEPSAFTKLSALGVEEQRVNVVIDFADPRAAWDALGDGYRVEAAIVVWQGGDVLTVPSGSVFRHGEEWAVFVREGGRARLRPIRTGEWGPDRVQVIDGVEEGDDVVLYPSDRVADGVRVEPS